MSNFDLNKEIYLLLRRGKTEEEIIKNLLIDNFSETEIKKGIEAQRIYLANNKPKLFDGDFQGIISVLREPRDRILLFFCLALLMSFAVKTIYVSGYHLPDRESGHVIPVSLRGSHGYITTSQHTWILGFFAGMAGSFLVIVISSLQMAASWWKSLNKRDII